MPGISHTGQPGDVNVIWISTSLVRLQHRNRIRIDKPEFIYVDRDLGVVDFTDSLHGNTHGRIIRDLQLAARQLVIVITRSTLRTICSSAMCCIGINPLRQQVARFVKPVLVIYIFLFVYKAIDAE